jgi:hypothetical protein
LQAKQASYGLNLPEAHANSLSEKYDQTGSGAPEAKKSRLAMNYFGLMVHNYSIS